MQSYTKSRGRWKRSRQGSGADGKTETEQMHVRDSEAWENQLPALMAGQLELRPQMQAQDAYKLLYQGVRGAEHLIAGEGQDFAQRLHEELESLEPRADEPLIESIHPAGRLQRLNLGPFKARQGDAAQLLAACLDAARQYRGTAEELEEVWTLFVRVYREGVWLGWELPDLDDFTRRVVSDDFPAVHHSVVYRSTYKPAYRLVQGRILDHR